MVLRSHRGQAAIDFLGSYGFAILIIAIAIYAVLQFGVFNFSASPNYCYAQSPFTCVAYSINGTGVMSIVLSQSSGGVLTVDGVACATSPNTIQTGPEYGNVHVFPYNSVTNGNTHYYPNAQLATGNTIYPGAQALFQVNCFSGSGGRIAGPIGSSFLGYIWVNYTFSGLPSGYHDISRVASISAKYT